MGTDSTTVLSRSFSLNGAATGSWLLEVLTSDGKRTNTTFTVNNATAATVTSISPTSGTTNTTVAVTIAGTGFTPASAKIRLYRSGNYIGGSVNSGGTTTQLTGSFNLDQATPATYEVCVLTDGTDANKKCGPSFIVYASASAANGSMYFTSTPAGAVVLVDSVNKGNTPFTLYNVTPGSYVVKMQRASYLEWSERVTVTAGNQTTVTGKLTPVDTSTTQTTAPTVVITTATVPPTTVKSTKTVPTPWSAATAAPTESPVDVVVVIGAIAVGCSALRRK